MLENVVLEAVKTTIQRLVELGKASTLEFRFFVNADPRLKAIITADMLEDTTFMTNVRAKI